MEANGITREEFSPFTGAREKYVEINVALNIEGDPNVNYRIFTLFPLVFHSAVRRKFNIELIRIHGANTNKALNLFDFLQASCEVFDQAAAYSLKY